MVRRLVEHQQVGAVDGVGDEQCPEGRPAPFTTGHGGQPGVEPVAQAQPLEHLPGRRVARPLVLGEAREQQLTDRQVRQLVALREQGNPDPGARRDPPRIGCFLPRDNPRQGALACAVSADDTDTIAVVDSHRNPVEQQRGAPGARDGIEGDKHSAAQVSGLCPERQDWWRDRPQASCAC